MSSSGDAGGRTAGDTAPGNAPKYLTDNRQVAQTAAQNIGTLGSQPEPLIRVPFKSTNAQVTLHTDEAGVPGAWPGHGIFRAAVPTLERHQIDRAGLRLDPSHGF